MNKPINIFASLVLLAGGMVALFSSCGGDTFGSDAVLKESKKTAHGRVIEEPQLDKLRDIYAKEKGDTVGFWADFNKVLKKMGKEAPEIKLPAGEVKKPLHVAMYMDNTSSMKGYIKPADKNVSTDKFARTLMALKNNYGDDGESLSCYYVDKNNYKEVTAGELNELISSRNLPMGDAYLFDELIGKIVDETLADTAHTRLNFFVTDAIPSGTNKQIKDNPKYNIDRKALLEDNIREQMKRLRGKNYGLSIFRFEAPFDGNYPDYSNKPRTLKNANRPYYIIAIGDKYELLDLREDVAGKGIRDFEPTNVFHAISDARPIKPVVKYNTRALAGDADKNNVMQYSFEKKGDNETVKVDLPLSALPEYLRDSDVVFDALEITYQGKPFAPANTEFGNDKASFPLMLMSRGNNEMTVRARNIYPGWVAAGTSRDDSGIETDADQQGKTFNFDIVVNGLVTGLFARNGEYLGDAARFNVKY